MRPQRTLLAHFSELMGQDHAHSPGKETTACSFWPRDATPTSQCLPSPHGELWAKASLGATGRMLHRKIISAPAQTKTQKFIGFPGIKNNLSLLSPVPVHKELGVFPFRHSKLCPTAFLHVKRTCRKEERFNIFLQVPSWGGRGGSGSNAPITQPISRHNFSASFVQQRPRH